MKIRGLAYRRLGKYEKAAIDLSNAMKIDYDPDIKDILDFISKRMAKISARKTVSKSSEGAAREWSTVVIVLVIFMI